MQYPTPFETWRGISDLLSYTLQAASFIPERLAEDQAEVEFERTKKNYFWGWV